MCLCPHEFSTLLDFQFSDSYCNLITYHTNSEPVCSAIETLFSSLPCPCNISSCGSGFRSAAAGRHRLCTGLWASRCSPILCLFPSPPLSPLRRKPSDVILFTCSCNYALPPHGNIIHVEVETWLWPACVATAAYNCWELCAQCQETPDWLNLSTVGYCTWGMNTILLMEILTTLNFCFM